MNRAAVHGLIRRRGNVIGWLHAQPPDPSQVDELTLGPSASLGGNPPPVGPFGESYPTRPSNIRAYISNKGMLATFQPFGIVEAGDQQLDVAVPFAPEPHVGIIQMPPALTQAYNDGAFAVTAPKDTDDTVTFDRFVIRGDLWVAKARAIPIYDNNVVVAWRILIARVTL